ncbi:hypothetical protein FB451DRAFT_1485482 [Mycena latifolia]|nr:hypothetical protein FB451DRAFT_1485482 [Mycena latifolia]
MPRAQGCPANARGGAVGVCGEPVLRSATHQIRPALVMLKSRCGCARRRRRRGIGQVHLRTRGGRPTCLQPGAHTKTRKRGAYPLRRPCAVHTTPALCAASPGHARTSDSGLALCLRDMQWWERTAKSALYAAPMSCRSRSRSARRARAPDRRPCCADTARLRQAASRACQTPLKPPPCGGNPLTQRTETYLMERVSAARRVKYQVSTETSK